MSTVVWKFSRLPRLSYERNYFVRGVKTAKKNLTENDVEEIKIPVPWGHIAGRWWGSKNQRPILCLHGWQDNANSFNTLIPLLNPENSYLAIDLPGHGNSSHLPKGLFYNFFESLVLLRRLQLEYEWPKLSLMGHSLGATFSFLYSSCFPDDVDFYIAIDILKPLSKKSSDQVKKAPKIIEKLLESEKRSIDTAPAYSKSDLIKTWIKGSNDSLTKETCEILIERGAEEKNGLYKLKRDCRLKIFTSAFSHEQNLQFAHKIKCSVLFIKALSSSYYDKKEDVIEVLDILRVRAKYLEHHELQGTHHLHLNNPEIVAPVINSFIKTVKQQI